MVAMEEQSAIYVLDDEIVIIVVTLPGQVRDRLVASVLPEDIYSATVVILFKTYWRVYTPCL